MLRGQLLEREIRRAMGAADVRSVAELARESGVQRDTLYAWFRGERPPKPDTLKRVADRLGVRVGELWDYEPISVPEGDLGPVLAEIRALAAELRLWKTEASARQQVILEELGTVLGALETLRARSPDEPRTGRAAPDTSRQHP